jgi:hypothetical protein
MNKIRDMLLSAGVKNLIEFGYPNCTKENILTDQIYKAFFISMLKDNLNIRVDIDIEINKLLMELS